MTQSILGENFMLILSRRVGQSVKIQDDITVTILEIRGNQARLGFQAPETIEVHRQEIFDRIQQEKKNDITVKPRIKTTAENK